jgi:hypothetical protein
MSLELQKPFNEIEGGTLPPLWCNRRFRIWHGYLRLVSQLSQVSQPQPAPEIENYNAVNRTLMLWKYI